MKITEYDEAKKHYELIDGVVHVIDSVEKPKDYWVAYYALQTYDKFKAEPDKFYEAAEDIANRGISMKMNNHFIGMCFQAAYNGGLAPELYKEIVNLDPAPHKFDLDRLKTIYDNSSAATKSKDKK